MDAAKIEECARAAHEVNRAYCIAQGDFSHPHWEELEEVDRSMIRRGVEQVLEGNSPREMHEHWAQAKIAHGWKFGTTKDCARKIHPCLVPYDNLPREQREKDSLFIRVVRNVAYSLGSLPPGVPGLAFIEDSVVA